MTEDRSASKAFKITSAEVKECRVYPHTACVVAVLDTDPSVDPMLLAYSLSMVT